MNFDEIKEFARMADEATDAVPATSPSGSDYQVFGSEVEAQFLGSGLSASNYYNPSDGTLVISYGGSETLADFLADAELGYLGLGSDTGQAIAARAHRDQVIALAEQEGLLVSRIVYVGHSLGGFLAQEALVTANTHASSAVVFNSTGHHQTSSDANVTYIYSDPAYWSASSALIHQTLYRIGDEVYFLRDGDPNFDDALGSHSLAHLSELLERGVVPIHSDVIVAEIAIALNAEYEASNGSPDLLVDFFDGIHGRVPVEILRKALEGSLYANECFAADTIVSLPGGVAREIESVRTGDEVISYDSSGELVVGVVSRVFRSAVSHLLDVHSLRVTPGHVTLCGDGPYEGRHVPIIDILVSDGALVTEGGDLVRAAIDAPVGSLEDAFVECAVALTSEDAASGRLEAGCMRVGTLLFDRDGAPVSVLDCLRAEGLDFDPETGLVARGGQEPGPLPWFGPLPRPEDYVLRRSRETLEGILTSGEWEGTRPELLERRMSHVLSARMQ